MKNNQKGQVLIFVIITMTIALALGVGLSLETISTISSVSDADTSQRALAAAEGAAERALTLSNTDLEALKTDLAGNCEGLLDGSYDSTEGECYVEFESLAVNNNELDARASVRVEDYTVTGSDKFSLVANEVIEFNLESYGGDMEICWAGDASIYYMVYNKLGESLKRIVMCENDSDIECNKNWIFNTSDSGVISDAPASTNPSYDTCTTVLSSEMPSDPIGIRIRALGDTIDAEIFPSITPFPTQGYKIIADGIVTRQSEINRRVTVYKSFEHAPAIFDFSFYSKENLSN